MEDNWTFNSVMGMMRTEAQRRANVAAAAGNQKLPADSTKAHLAKGRNGGGGGSGGKKSKLAERCFHCDQ